MNRIAVMILTLLIAMAATGASAAIVTRDVEYKQGDVTLQGYVAYDDSVKKAPAILVVHQWKGLTDYEKMRAGMLAELGYVVFAADIYGKGVRPEDNKEAGSLASRYREDRKLMRARARAALNEMLKLPQADAERTAAIGYCFGGTVVLELARDGADMDGFVTFHGGLDTPTPGDAKNIKGKVLALHGAADQSVTPDIVAAFQDEMSDAGVDWYMSVYAYAPHAFTQKGPRYNEPADRRSWNEMKLFFSELFD